MKAFISAVILAFGVLSSIAGTYLNSAFLQFTPDPVLFDIADGSYFDAGSIPFSAVNSSFSNLVSAKFNLPTGGTSANYIDGTGALRTFPSIPTVPAILVTNLISHTIVTSSNSANGFTLNSSRPMFVTYSATITSSSTLSGGASGYVVLETCASNSSTGTDWMENGRVTNGQNNSLIIGLGLTQPAGGSITTIVPSGYYIRLRSVNTVGTCTFTYSSGVEASM